MWRLVLHTHPGTAKPEQLETPNRRAGQGGGRGSTSFLRGLDSYFPLASRISAQRFSAGTYRKVPVMTKRIELTVSEETWEQIDKARGLVPRAAWIKAAVDQALEVVEKPRVEVEKAGEVLGSTVRKVPSLKDTWGR